MKDIIVGLAVVLVVGATVTWLWRATQRPPVHEGADVPTTDPRAVYDPTEAGVELPDGYRQVLPRDHIRPIYDPRFVPASQVDWPDDTLVLAVELNGEAQAYPINVLNFREMVLTRLGGEPLLATW